MAVLLERSMHKCNLQSCSAVSPQIAKKRLNRNVQRKRRDSLQIACSVVVARQAPFLQTAIHQPISARHAPGMLLADKNDRLVKIKNLTTNSRSL